MVSIEKLLTYEGLTEYLRKKDYDEIRDGEFVVHRDTELAETWILVVRQSENYFQGLKAIKDEIKVGDVVEGERKDFGILFSGNKITFVGRVYGGEAELSSASKIKHITKSLDNLSNPAFKKKIKSFIRWLDNPSKIKYWEQLFDRSDIIEEFYQLFLKAREHLSNNVMGITDDTDKMKFVDDLMLQLLIVWYLQAKGFLDDNKQYLIEKFDEYKKHGEYAYFEFLKNLFDAMKGINVHDSFVENDELGKIYVTGPAPFLDTYGKFPNAKIRNEAFYFTDDDSTEVNRKKKKLVMSAPRTLEPKDVPVLALFESRDWIDGDIDRFVIGSLFEKLMTREERKQTGSYYTPEEITMYISENTIKPYIVDKLNSVLNTNYESLDEFFEKETREDAYIQLFKILQGIKIIDPACGSGHFLESAIDTLVSIYRQLREKIKEHNFDSSEFTIVTADEKGLIKKISLLDIDDDNMFELLVMFHIIISRNIYGVDIQENAVKITEARLFLALAEKFNKDIGVFIRFPNVHFNIRSGNSLVGFTDIEGFKRIESKGRQTTLFEALTVVPKKKTTSIPQKIDLAISRDLREYIKNIDKALSLNKSTLELISSVRTNSDKPITVDRIKEVLMLKENLTRILLVSLNTPHVWDIKNIIEHITVAFNQRLDEEFLGYLSEEKGVNITSEELQRIGTFHWVLEFPEVFLDNGGFDVIIGNPPYGRIKQLIKDKKEKELHSKLYKALYKYQTGNFNLYKLFLERSYFLLRENGYFGMIFPSSFLGENDSKKLRKLFFDENQVSKILEFPEKAKVFVGVTQAVAIFIYTKKKSTEDYEVKIRTNIPADEKRNLDSLTFLKVKKSELKELTGDEYRIPLFLNPRIEWEILKHISKYPPFRGDENNPPMGDVGEGHLHETFDKDFMSDEPGDDLLIKGIHLDRYFVNLDPDGPKPRWIVNKEKFFEKKPEAKENIKFERVIGRNTINKASKPRLRFSMLPPGYVITNSIKFITLKEKSIHKFFLISLLNSKMLNWRFELFSTQNNIRNYEIEALPIPRISLKDQKPFIILAKYMIFLKQYYNYFAKTDRHIQYIIDYFDNLVDCLVYELYLGDVVRIPIIDLVEDKLEDIELPSNLLKEDKKKIETIFFKIESVFRRLEADKKLNENLYLIKLHPWIKQIYTYIG